VRAGEAGGTAGEGVRRETGSVTRIKSSFLLIFIDCILVFSCSLDAITMSFFDLFGLFCRMERLRAKRKPEEGELVLLSRTKKNRSG